MCNYTAEFRVLGTQHIENERNIHFDTGNRTNLLASEKYCYRALTYSAISEYE